MKSRLSLLCFIFLWGATWSAFPAEPITFQSSDSPVTLIELFTSEGCSSCPAAEKWLSRLKTSPDLWTKTVPAAFHVDYWDHLGWTDRFAKSLFTERQRHYAAAWKGESVYTPGFAADGKEWRGWFTGASLPSRNSKVGNLRVTLTNDFKITGTFVPEAPTQRPLIFEAALLGSNRESNVKRGENSGRKLRHDFVVLQFGTSKMTTANNQWSGSLSLSSNSTEKPDAVAAWVVAPDTLEVVQATGGWITPPR